VAADRCGKLKKPLAALLEGEPGTRLALIFIPAVR
jgi:hypothetical protein